MKKNQVISAASLITIILVVLYLIFIHFPLMGHDYSLGISWSNDYQYAWKKFGVFNIIFTPQRCLGVPVWSNPIGVNFSLYHVLSIIFKDINVIVIYTIIILSTSYFGVRKFLSLFEINGPWQTYLAIGWCLQGYITTRAVVGHLPFINLGLWPFYAYLLIKKNNSFKKNILSCLLFSIAYAHDFYMANTYLFVMFPIAFAILLVIMKMNQFEFDLKWTTKRFLLGSLLTTAIIAPKVIAVFKFTRNFQRDLSFFPIKLIDSINYIFMNLVIPVPLNYNEMTGWNYGNWESISYIFPLLFPILICKSSLEIKKYSRIFVSFLILLGVGIFIASGSYAEIIKNIPVVKSFHVNPRWMPIISLGLLSVSVFFLKRAQLKPWLAILLTTLSLGIPFYFIDEDYFEITYLYRRGMDVAKNRISYCYEPIFGYRLELLPADKIKGDYLDPRCYISQNKCEDINLKPELKEKLESYSLEPFSN
jgi:hypothetical protein